MISLAEILAIFCVAWHAGKNPADRSLLPGII
jgi:hypothetical protein